MKQFIALALLILLSSCGYRFERGDKVSVTVPYVLNDFEGKLTGALIRSIAQHPSLSYSHDQGKWILSVKIMKHDDERIGFRYDRSPVSEKLRKHLEGVENRRFVTAEVLIVSSETEEILYGPQQITEEIDYDYIYQDSLKELSVTLPSGKIFPSEGFSLGQLDTVDAASDDAMTPLFRKLAQKIVDGITVCCDQD